MIDEGERKTSIRVLSQRVDIRFTRPSQFGTMLLYLTGSKALTSNYVKLLSKRDTS
jgi:DNA polymerase/3'-5' exonuclease PolX